MYALPLRQKVCDSLITQTSAGFRQFSSWLKYSGGKSARRAQTLGAAPPTCEISARVTALQSRQQIRHVRRQRRGEFQLLARHRVFKAQGRGVQRLAGETIGQFCRRPKQLFSQASLATIGLIPNQPMARIGHMDADLMGAAGFKPAFHQAGSTLKVLNHTGTGHRVAALLPNHSLPLAVSFVAGKVSGDLQDAARLKADPAQQEAYAQA